MRNPEPAGATLATSLDRPDVTLDDKFTLPQGEIYLSGVQALVRLLIEQRARDRDANLDTRGFVSGYRGSPLGGFDTVLWQQEKRLNAQGILFSPGLNEDLAATALWGTQQVGLFGPATTDGVFGLWYGKGPGVDRSLDALKHANLAGTSPHGGVLAVAGDDHISQSSTLAHQSEQTLIAAMIPILNPSSVQDYLDFGLLGYALSRFSGCWVGFKALAETVESSASISVDPTRLEIVLPDDFSAPPGGLHICWPDPPLAAEARLHGPKMAAVAAFARANRVDRVMTPGGPARLGIVTSGKSYLDVRQALIELGIADRAAQLGIRVYKVGLTWPLESEGALAFAHGVDEVLVVEEKQPLIESQLTRLFYNLAADRRPRIVGKTDERGSPLLASIGQLGAAEVARAIHLRLRALGVDDPAITARVARLDSFALGGISAGSSLARAPFFCSGCPHNSSTRLPEGSRAHGGIGCHGMATFLPERNTPAMTQMGGEGANWIGQAPFSSDTHIFQNLGDGTYAHSGLLAIRAAVAARVNITYKILFNDAVAMTGGQPAEGQFTVAQIVAQVAAEGVAQIVVVSDEPDRHARSAYPPSVELLHRDYLDAIQRRLRDVAGTTVLIYEQTCAAEKRRRRKRGLLVDPPKRVFINPEVCEGCGDCSAVSNCIAVTPLETELGRKRQIDQSSCNKDYSCTKGFCPSFVIVEGGTYKGARGTAALPQDVPAVPPPVQAPLDRPWNVLIAGIGGTGVVTIGALLGMAAHLARRGCTVSDFTGLSQKNGAVSSHVRLAAKPEDLHSVRIAPGAADLLLAYDQIVATTPDILSRLEGGVSYALINAHVAPPTAFVANPELDFEQARMRHRLTALLGDRAIFVDATQRAAGLLGDAIGANLFLLGCAFQQGLIPLPLEAIERAIELNGAAVAMNRRAFAWGRLQAHDPAQISALLGGDTALPPQTAADVIGDRRTRLAAYQDEAYAERFLRTIDTVRAAETRLGAGDGRLTQAVAKSLYRLMAYKDEYEVARLHTASGFREEILTQFGGAARITYSFAPPLFARRDPASGHLLKRRYGPWMHLALRVLAKGRRLRGTRLDPFGYLADRKLERLLIADYEATVATLLGSLDGETLGAALAIAELPMTIKGYGHVKDHSIHAYRESISQRMMQFVAAGGRDLAA